MCAQLVYFFLMMMYIPMTIPTTASTMMTKSTVWYAGISTGGYGVGYCGSMAIVLDAASCAISSCVGTSGNGGIMVTVDRKSVM